MKKNSAWIYMAAFTCFAAAIGGLCYAGFSENSVYFLNVSEARAVKPEALRQARLFGLVSPGYLKQELNSVVFHLADKDNASQTIAVTYTGLVPDTFKAGAEVIVEGFMQANGQFNANTLMTKCPSKYQKENRKI